MNDSWLSTSELEQLSITRHLALRYAPTFEFRHLARRTGETNGPGGNPWLFHPSVVPFLQSRLHGRPRREPSKAEVERIGESYYGSTNAIARELGVSWRLAHRWLVLLGLKDER
jgi:hypothetical protein